MRSAFVLGTVVSALAAVAGSFAPAPVGAAAPKSTISCASKTWSWMNPRDRPGHCVIFAHNQPIHAYEFDLHKIHWHRWGHLSTTGTADAVYVGMGQTDHAAVRLWAYRRRTACGHRAYTRLRVRFKRDGSVSTLRPPACRKHI